MPATQQKRGSFAELIQRTVGQRWTGEWLVVDCRVERRLPPPEALAGLVVTGSPSSVIERQPWMLEGQRYLEASVRAGVPVLGVCFGHQMLAEALGGRVEKNPRGREIGTVEFSPLDDDPLVNDPERPFEVNMSHMDSVVALPPGARVLGTTDKDPYAAIRFAERAWGVQFHPEFDREIVGQYAMTRAEALAAEGLDPEAIKNTATDASAGARVLSRFVSTLRR